MFPSLSYTFPPALSFILFPFLRPLYVLERFFHKISRFFHVLYVFLRMFAFRPLKKSKKYFAFFLGRKVLSFKRKPVFCEPLPPYFVIFFYKNIWPYRKKLVLLHSQMRQRPYERYLRRSVLWNTYITFSREVQDQRNRPHCLLRVLRPGIKKDPRQVRSFNDFSVS